MAARDNGDEGARRMSGVPLMPGPWTQRVELIAGPEGFVLHTIYMTQSTHLHLFGTPEEWESAAHKILDMVQQARTSLYLPPGTVMPEKENERDN